MIGGSIRPISQGNKGREKQAPLPNFEKSVAMGGKLCKSPIAIWERNNVGRREDPTLSQFMDFNPIIYNISGKYIN
jgi:hypothetical protein